MSSKRKKYLFQRKKTSFTKRFFEKGLNVASYILFSLEELGDSFQKEVFYASFAPNFLKSIVGSDALKKRFKKVEILVNLRRLEKQGLLRKEQKRKIYILTEKGKELISYIKDRYSILEKKWDGKLRVVIFDIPEKRKLRREWLREELLLLNYKMIQKSVYIGKYPLPETFYRDIIQFGLDDSVFVFTINRVDKKDKLIKLLEE